MTADLLFYLGLSLLFVHELDAIQRHEWRIFPLLSRMKEETAYPVFVLAHVPLFMLAFWLISSPSPGVRYWFQLIIDLLLVAHLGLHQLFRKRSDYEFTSAFSKSIIRLAALFGSVHFVSLLV